MKFRKKSIVIEAEQFTDENKNRCFNFVRCNCYPIFIEGKSALKIETLEGDMIANLGDWVIKGIKGEFYPCKKEIFEATYEPVSESE